MSNKNQNAPEATTEATEKNPTLATRLRRTFIEFMDQVSASGKVFAVAGVGSDTLKALVALREEIGDGRAAGLPAPERLAAANKELDEHYAGMPMKNGKPAPTPEWNADTQKLLNRISRIEREIKDGGASRGKGGKANNATESASA